MNKNQERRIFSSTIELRAETDQPALKLVGYGAIFNSLSENLGGFKEMIAPGAFDNVLENDVRALFNHDVNHVLGRTKSGTLKLSVDEIGLRYEIDLPDTQTARDLMESVQRGDVDQSSFGFSVRDDSWISDENGNILRTILKIERLFDVSPVTYPAYSQTMVSERAINQCANTVKPDLNALKNKLKLLNY